VPGPPDPSGGSGRPSRRGAGPTSTTGPAGSWVTTSMVPGGGGPRLGEPAPPGP